MRKRMALLFVALLIFAGGCAWHPSSNVSEHTSGSADSTVTDPLEALPARDDWQGRDFIVYYGQHHDHVAITAQEDQSDTVRDAMACTNRTLIEHFGVNLVEEESAASVSPYMVLETAIANGTYLCDVFCGHDVSMGSMMLRSQFQDVRVMPGVDVTKPWWPQQTVNSLTIGGRMYLFTNDITCDSFSSALCLSINKTLAEQQEVELPYQKVKDKEWTLDAFYVTMKDFHTEDHGESSAAMDCLEFSFSYDFMQWDQLQSALGIAPTEPKEKADLWLPIPAAIS